MDYVVSKEKFLELKEYQKSLVGLRREAKKAVADYSRKLQSWRNSKPENASWQGTVYNDWLGLSPRFPSVLEKNKARAFNILYGLLKGKKYEQIENPKKVDGSTISDINVAFNHIIKDFDLDREKIKQVLISVPFIWK